MGNINFARTLTIFGLELPPHRLPPHMFLTDEKMDPLWIPMGSLWILCGSLLDSCWIRFGFLVDTYGFQMDPHPAPL